MKDNLHRLILVLITLFACASQAAAQEVTMPKELEAIRAEYSRRQDIAIQPVKAWYRQELERMVKSALQRNDLEAAVALRKERESLVVAPIGTQTLTIVKATYGAGNHTVDVTRQVQMVVTNNKLQLKAPWAFSPDPAAGVHKEIKIQYRYGGKERVATFKSEEDLTLP